MKWSSEILCNICIAHWTSYYYFIVSVFKRSIPLMSDYNYQCWLFYLLYVVNKSYGVMLATICPFTVRTIRLYIPAFLCPCNTIKYIYSEPDSSDQRRLIHNTQPLPPVSFISFYPARCVCFTLLSSCLRDFEIIFYFTFEW